MKTALLAMFFFALFVSLCLAACLVPTWTLSPSLFSSAASSAFLVLFCGIICVVFSGFARLAPLLFTVCKKVKLQYIQKKIEENPLKLYALIHKNNPCRARIKSGQSSSVFEKISVQAIGANTINGYFQVHCKLCNKIAFPEQYLGYLLAFSFVACFLAFYFDTTYMFFFPSGGDSLMYFKTKEAGRIAGRMLRMSITIMTLVNS